MVQDTQRSVRGAMAVEFLVAFVPMLLALFCFAEVLRKQCANVMLQYAATIGARAAAVLVRPNPNDPGSVLHVQRAVEAALGRWNASSFYTNVSVSSTIASASDPDPNAMDTVTVQ